MPEKLQRKILTTISSKRYEPVSVEKLARSLGVYKPDMETFRKSIEELHHDGRVLIGEDNTVRLADKEGTITGTFRANVKGFGFVIPSDPEATEDLYIAREFCKGAMTGDLVQATVHFRRVGQVKRIYGKIVNILSRGRNKFTGTLFRSSDQWFVETNGKVLHRPVIIGDISAQGAAEGKRVIVSLTEYPRENSLPRGVIEQVLGNEGRYDAEIQAAVNDFDLPGEFPDGIEEELAGVVDKFHRYSVNLFEKGKVPKGRVDLRDKTIVTIDPDDAKDFDDAFSVDLLEDGYELGVHIADVSSFLEEGSLLDREAKKRGNSVYLPRKVIPMLPETLSNGLCSLQENQDRLTKSAFIRYDFAGNVIGSRLENTVIRSSKRLTYSQATKMLSGSNSRIPCKIRELVKTAEHLAKTIFARRYKEGTLHLELPDAELIFDRKGQVIDVRPADTSFSHTMIEMFMVEANETVARFLDSSHVPFLRRVHPEPKSQSLERLSEFLKLLRYNLPPNADRFDLQKLLKRVKGKSDSFAVNYAILRTLQAAQYNTQSIGHFALASKYYCHFTSPIRRYPDLTVHRLLQLHFEGKLKKRARQLRQDEPHVISIGEHCTLTEKQAENAERQVKETLVLDMLRKHLGEDYDGLITGIGAIGAFVQISRFMIEGLIPMAEIGDDRWEVDTDRGFIRGKRTKRMLKIGDSIRVRIMNVDITRRRLDLKPAEAPPSRRSSGSRKKTGNAQKRRSIKSKKTTKHR